MCAFPCAAASACVSNITYILDPSNFTLGQPPPEGVYHPLRDVSLSLKERGEAFMVWVSCYFETIQSLHSVTSSVLSARKALNEKSTSPDTLKVPTVHRMTKEELDAVIDREVLERSSNSLLRTPREVLRQNVEKALVDTGGLWPNVKVLLVWCNQTMHDCVWAAKAVADLAQNPAPGSREIEVERLHDANHFVRQTYTSIVTTNADGVNSLTGMLPRLSYRCSQNVFRSI